MDRVVIYHGSDHVVKEPEYGFGGVHNDYGPGFYCTQDIEIAKEWANKSTEYGYVNKYQFDGRGLKILDLTSDKYNVLNWIAILMHYRDISSANRELYKRRLAFLEDNYFIDISEFDVIIGYRADDSYFKFPLSFIRNELSIEKLEEIYKLGDLGKQIVLISEKAFSKLTFLKAESVDPIYKEKYQTRKNEADIKFERIRIEEINSLSSKIMDLVRDYDKRK